MEDRFAPTASQLTLLSAIAEHIAVAPALIATGDIEADLTTTIDLRILAKQGLIRYTMGDKLIRCTPAGRRWVHGHENWRAGELRRCGSGH